MLVLLWLTGLEGRQGRIQHTVTRHTHTHTGSASPSHSFLITNSVPIEITERVVKLSTKTIFESLMQTVLEINSKSCA